MIIFVLTNFSKSVVFEIFTIKHWNFQYLAVPGKRLVYKAKRFACSYILLKDLQHNAEILKNQKNIENCFVLIFLFK